MILEETEQSKIFDNEEFGHRKVAVERPLSMEVAGTHHAYRPAEIWTLKESGTPKERGTPTIKKVHRRGTATNWLYGLNEVEIGCKSAVIEYEPGSNLRATEQIPLTAKGGIDGFLIREVLRDAPKAWYRPDSK